MNLETRATLLGLGAPCLLPTRLQVAKENKKCLNQMLDANTSLQRFGCPAEDIYATDGKPSGPENAYNRPEDTGGLESLLDLAVGARVMLRMNLDVPDGLVNGATGWVKDFVFHEESTTVVGVWVLFDLGGKRWMRTHKTLSVRIDLRSGYFLGKLDKLKVRRLQFPLVLAWAKPMHKGQGATEPHG
eukprot:6079243-Heterocapsa_arctica.AAC.1